MEAKVRWFSESPSVERARTTLYGLGSAGCNMIAGAPLPTVAVSTSASDLERSRAQARIHLEPSELVGLSQTDPEVIQQTPSVLPQPLRDVMSGVDLACLMVGLGGVTGSVSARLFSSLTKSRKKFGLGLATTPFSAESGRRRDFASETLSAMVASLDLVVEFDNDKLSTLAPNLALSRAFSLMNNIMIRPALDMSSVMSRDDASALREVLGDARCGRFGLGMGRGDERVERVVSEALGSPWFDFPLDEAVAAIAIYASSDPWDKEVRSIADMLGDRLPNARLVMGSYADSTLGDKIRMSLILCRPRFR
jgi:cell division GTPase FtsZ